ncbi:MAG: hypothetical protein NC321_07115 [Clostridium sp.]|nr:hypothetical protein [Clostridium sp.]
MPHQQTDSSKTAPCRKHNTNWHEAAACAIQIELQEYKHLLQFLSEYVLGKNNYRIDLLIIKKLSRQIIPKNIAHIFKTYNIFEIKGIGSSINTDAYYKTIGYAGILINQSGKRNQYTALDISLSFLSFHYPKRLMNHLQKDRKLVVENFSKGVYHIINEIFNVQIIVVKELLPEDNLYLHCLTDNLNNTALINQLIDDYQQHREQDIYIRYMDQLAKANSNAKGESSMFEEMMERAKQEAEAYYTTYYETLLDTANNKNKQLAAQVDYLENLLRQNNIQFE